MSLKPPVAFVLLSGGLDSTTCLYLARTQFQEVRAVSINYGQRHSKELSFARQSSSALGIPHHIINIPNLIPSTMLTDQSQQVPNISYDEIKGVSPTYVPFRNGLMLSVMTSYAHGTLINEGRDSERTQHGIYFGAHAEDAANFAYPDCTPAWIADMGNAINIGTYYRIKLYAPLQTKTKAQVVALGTSLGVNFSLTWSCYRGETLHCGVCPTCRSRRQAFITAGVTDPTVYFE